MGEPQNITISGAGNYINATEAAISTGAFARHGLVAGQPVTYNKAGDYFYQFADPKNYDSVKEFKDEELKKKILEDEEKNKRPLPTAADPHPPELIPDDSEALAVYTSPDVVKVGDKPVPFASHGKGSDDENYSPDVRSNGKIIKRHNSKMYRTYGAEPGDAGIKSGTEGQKVEPVSSSPIVRANGIPVQRHTDTCTLNNGNAPCEYVHVQSTEVNKAPGGNDEDGRKKADTRSTAGKGWDGFYNNSSEAQAVADGIDRVGQWVSDPSKFGQDLQGVYEALPTGDQVLEFGQNVATGAVEGAEYVINNPGAAAKGAWNWGVDGLKNLWGGVTDAYDQGGVAQAGGHLAAAAVGAVNPLKKAKWAGRAVEELGDVGDGVKAKQRLDQDSAVESGEGGARSTGKKQRTRNPCAHLAKGDPNGAGDYRGGSYGGVPGSKDLELESNHVPPKSVYPESLSDSVGGENRMPAFQMDYDDHRDANSTGSSRDAQNWRKTQQNLIDQGRYRDATAMDYKDARRIAREAGDPRKYNQAMREHAAYRRCLEKHGLLPGKKK